MSGLTSVGAMANEVFMLRVKEEANCILAEIVRLASFIPQDFTDPKSSKFRPLILDFIYFSKAADYEKLIAENEDLQDHFYNTNGDLLSRFSTLFQTIAVFLCSLKEYSEQVDNDRIGISYLDVVDIEIIFHIGLVLLYIEKFLPGVIRERIYVAIYRNSDEQRHVDFLVDFLRVNSSSETNYLFERLKINESFIERCLSCCETIYKEGANDFEKLHVDKNTIIKWMFVCLLFKPCMLKAEHIKMRQIVEDFFREDWVLQLGLGLNVNLMDSWQYYRAAFAAITSQMDIKKAKDMASFHYSTLVRLAIPQGKISPVDFDAHSRLISQYNSSLRWLILHTSETTTRKALSYVQAVDVHPQLNAQLLVLLLRLSNFEMNFFTAYNDCLRNKEESIKKVTSSTCSVISEMVQIFSQDFGLLNKDRKTKLHDWFLLIKRTLEDLEPSNKRNGLFVIQIKRRIAQVGEMLDLNGRLALAQHLQMLKSHLDSLFALYNVEDDEERRVRRSADPSYLWPILDDWTSRIQCKILESSNAHAVRALFFKLSLSISVLCEQFENNERKRLISRAYSYHLVRRLRTILQSIPHKLFSILKNAVSPLLQMRWEPNMDKTVVRTMAHFEENFNFAEATYTISNLSLGVSRMALKKVGVVSVNPKDLLREGIRRELALELPRLITVSETPFSLEDVLKNLSDSLHCFHRAFIYMCGHVDISGYDMWRDELDYILMRMTRDVMEKRLTSSQNIPSNANSVQALSVIINLLLKHSDPVCNRYMEDSMTWREIKTKKDVLSSKVIDSVERWIPSTAINSLRTILNHDMEICINDTLKLLNTLLTSIEPFTFDEAFVQSTQFDQLLRLIHGNSLLPRFIMKAGQLFLLLSMLCQSRKQHCQLNAAPLFSALSACDRFLLASPDSVPADVAPLLNLLRDCGLCSPSRTFYKSCVRIPSNAPLCFLLTLFVTMHKLNGSRQDGFCRHTFIADSLTLLKNAREKQLLLLYCSSVNTFC